MLGGGGHDLSWQPPPLGPGSLTVPVTEALSSISVGDDLFSFDVACQVMERTYLPMNKMALRKMFSTGSPLHIGRWPVLLMAALPCPAVTELPLLLRLGLQVFLRRALQFGILLSFLTVLVGR